MVVRLSFLTLVCAIAVSLARLVQAQPSNMLDTFRVVFQHWFYQAAVVVIVGLNLRHILFRLRERDTRP